MFSALTPAIHGKSRVHQRGLDSREVGRTEDTMMSHGQIRQEDKRRGCSMEEKNLLVVTVATAMFENGAACEQVCVCAQK